MKSAYVTILGSTPKLFFIH